MQQDHTLTLANLATATQADRTSVALLTNTISEISSQVAHLTEKLATAQVENARIKKSGHQSTTSRNGHRSSINSTLSDPTSSQIEMYNPEADRGSTLTGTATPTATRWRSLTRLWRVASPVMITTSQICD